MKYKKGDRFFIEVVIDKVDDPITDGIPIRVHFTNYEEKRDGLYVSERFFNKAQKIRPVYKENQYYWVRRKPYSGWTPYLHIGKDIFYGHGEETHVDLLYEIGDEVEIPEKYRGK